MRRPAWIPPRSMAGQMIAILALSFALLLVVLAALEALEQEDVVEWAESGTTLGRLRRMRPAAELIDPDRVDEFLRAAASCHEGYTLTDGPFVPVARSQETDRIAARIARGLQLSPADVRVGRAWLTRSDFAYAACEPASIVLPTEGVVISLRLGSGRWLNAEVHPHEWHVRDEVARWMARSIGAFLFVGAIAVFFVRRLAGPLDRLTAAAERFGRTLEVEPVAEGGPADLERAIHSFNDMQGRVAAEIGRRTHTLAAISHDVRTPLTALRIKAELIEDPIVRGDMITSIDAMERLTATALDFLRGESRGEPMRLVDLAALVESECADAEEAGGRVTCGGASSLPYWCRPDALACAVRNLIDNAVKYASAAEVTVRAGPDVIDIAVSDWGPGIPAGDVARALEPFERLSPARESGQGGFGLGLAIVLAIARGHGGELLVEPNRPSGLVVTLRLPRAQGGAGRSESSRRRTRRVAAARPRGAA
jgi:signal transduction histidine kinase